MRILTKKVAGWILKTIEIEWVILVLSDKQGIGASVMRQYRKSRIEPIQNRQALRGIISKNLLNMCRKSIRSLTLILVLVLTGKTSAAGGLTGKYYNNISLIEPLVLTRFEAVNFDWGNLSPQPGVVNNDQFSVHWSGAIVPKYSETYRFITRSDDGVRLWVNRQLIIDNWTYHSVTTDVSQQITLRADKEYPIKMEFFESSGQAVAELYWESSSQPFQIISEECLSPTFVQLKAWQPTPADGAQNQPKSILYWNAGDTAAAHDVYFGSDEASVTNATSDSPEFTEETNLLYCVLVSFLQQPEGSYYWRIDEVVDDMTIIKGDVWRFTTAPLKAHSPVPTDCNQFTDPNIILTWGPGFNVKTTNGHRVFFGDCIICVLNADTSTIWYKGVQSGTSFDPTPDGTLLPLDTTYYWRIDEVNKGNTVIKGDVWEFRTSLTSTTNPDFNNDGFVNFRDYVELAQAWRRDVKEPQLEKYDFDDNGTIDAVDLGLFARKWLVYDECAVINIDETVKFQEMDGFGASLTESSAYLISHSLTEQQRQQLMLDLFDPEIGIGLSYLRQPMGSSDFRLTDYTYDDMPAGQTDFELEKFSIARDRLFIIPLLQEAVAISPDIRIMGTPWSSPAWMKDSGELGYGRLIDSDAIYTTYANYFVKYIQAYAVEGLAIDAITLQNEPYYEPFSYPGMRMEPTDQIRLAILLGQKFDANGINTKIVIWDHNWDNPGYPITVLDDPEANPYIAGTAFHGYGGDVSAQLDVVAAHPDKDIYFTECSGGDWAPSFGDNLMWDTSTLIIKAVRYYAKTVVKWNLALDENRGPKLPGGCGDCRGVVTINGSTGQVTREVEYYSLGHAAKFVRPGARRIDSTEWNTWNIQNVAFVNPDGSIAIIVLNPNNFRKNVEFKWKGQSLIYGLPSRSVTTFRWPDQINAIVEIWITTADHTKLLEKQSGTRFY